MIHSLLITSSILLAQCGPEGAFRCGPPPGPGGYPGEYRQPYRYYSPDMPMMRPGEYPPVRQGPLFNPRYRSRPEFYPGPMFPPPPGYR